VQFVFKRRGLGHPANPKVQKWRRPPLHDLLFLVFAGVVAGAGLDFVALLVFDFQLAVGAV
jgi:hypothetical protein